MSADSPQRGLAAQLWRAEVSGGQLFEIRSDKRATFVCLGFKLWNANPVSFNLSIQCSKEVVCIEDLGELIDTFLFLLRRDPDATENSASAKRLQHLYGFTQCTDNALRSRFVYLFARDRATYRFSAAFPVPYYSE
jgi:hypothetical protein